MAMFAALQRPQRAQQPPRAGTAGSIIGAVGGGQLSPGQSRGGIAPPTTRPMGAQFGPSSAPPTGRFGAVDENTGFSTGNTAFRQAPRPRQPLNSAMGQAAGRMGMGASVLSDENSKETIRALRSRLADLGGSSQSEAEQSRTPRELDPNPFSSAQNYSYEYKNPDAPGAAHGRQVGPMAQDLERIPGVVNERPDGMKEVNTPRLSMATAGEVGSQRRELEELRKRLADLEGDPDAVLREAAGER